MRLPISPSPPPSSSSSSSLSSSTNASSGSGSGSELDYNEQIHFGRIRKTSREQRQRYQLMNRLRTMVPNARSATTQLELLQYIIDYISHLQVSILCFYFKKYKIKKIRNF